MEWSLRSGGAEKDLLTPLQVGGARRLDEGKRGCVPCAGSTGAAVGGPARGREGTTAGPARPARGTARPGPTAVGESQAAAIVSRISSIDSSCPLLTRAMSTVDSEPHSKPAAASRSRDTRAMSAPSRGASAAVPARPPSFPPPASAACATLPASPRKQARSSRPHVVARMAKWMGGKRGAFELAASRIRSTTCEIGAGHGESQT